HSARKLSLIGDLRCAVDQDELVLHYQPKIHMHTGRVAGVEALVRWKHPSLGVMGPSEFIPLAEHTGHIRPISAWVLNSALRQLQEWQQNGHQLSMAINLSPVNLQDPALVQNIEWALSWWKIDPKWLVLEITESALMADPERALNTLARL